MFFGTKQTQSMIRGLEAGTRAHRTIALERVVIMLYVTFVLRTIYLAFDKPQYMPTFAAISLLTARLCVPMGLLYVIWQRKLKMRDVFLLIIPLSYWLMRVFHTYGGYHGGGELMAAACCLFLLFSSNTKIKIFDAVYWTIQIINVISIILEICFFTGIDIGFQAVPYYGSGPNLYYHKWFIFTIYQSTNRYRLCGIFNEPGALGTACGLLLACRYKYMKRWEKVLLITTGLLSFSFAFYVLLFAYYTLYLCSKRPENIVLLLLSIVIFFTLPYIDFHNEQINATMARFAIVDGKLKGDDRTTSEFDEYYEEFLEGDDVVFGIGAEYPWPGGASYKTHYVVPFGIVGCILLLTEWLCASAKLAKRRRSVWIFVVLFFASLYQRPNAILALWGYVFFFGGIEWLSQKEMNAQKERVLRCI